MGVIVNKQNTNEDDLSRRIEADLRSRADTSLVNEEIRDPDFVGDSDYVKDLKKTGRFGWFWVVLIILAIISLISIVFL